MTTQVTADREIPRSFSISGRASTTIVPSTAEMSTPIITTSMPRARRGGMGAGVSADPAAVSSLTIADPLPFTSRIYHVSLLACREQ